MSLLEEEVAPPLFLELLEVFEDDNGVLCDDVA